MLFITADKREILLGKIGDSADGIYNQELGSILSNIMEIVSALLDISTSFEYEENKRIFFLDENKNNINSSALNLIAAMNEEIKKTFERICNQSHFNKSLSPYINEIRDTFINDNPIINSLIILYKYLLKCSEKLDFFSIDNFYFICLNYGFNLPPFSPKFLDEDYQSINERNNIEIEELLSTYQKFISNKYSLYISYECSDLLDICLASINEILRQNVLFAQCIHCHRFFMPNRANVLYCDKIAPESKKVTCKNYAKNKRESNAIQNSEIKTLLKKIYNKKRNRTIRYPENQEYQKDLESFFIGAGAFQDDVKAGKHTEIEYIQWLNEKHSE